MSRTDHDTVAQRQASMRLEKVRLESARARLVEIRRHSKRAVNGADDRAQRMLRADHQIDCHLATIEQNIARLCDEQLDSWHEVKRDLNIAWDDLAESIKDLVLRVSGER